ncbi:uncharacterized protein FFB20_09380 [Fusarium fujikuroi]|nr:uncharacterized protein FFB20_09380 [Fusarium fujikuroi]SCO01512.1 uncharacterized protein FFM5_07600 [Fusarium fujikuroi]SCO46028.1 uncharacterized protein FFNC_10637 [Fusarium fujikuroi]SCV47644.1 uncharacterized protein FFFS_08220 [Fusarium fujikuroi]
MLHFHGSEFAVPLPEGGGTCASDRGLFACGI